MEKRWDVLGLGCTAVDDLIYVDHYPEPDEKVRALREERQCGGLTATALVAAARLGASCGFGGTLGSDSLSQFVEGILLSEGIDLTPLVRRDDAQPIHATIVVDVNRHTRSIYSFHGGVTGCDELLLDEETIRAAKVLFIDHHGPEGTLRAAKIAREANTPVVADFERHNGPLFDQILRLTDHLILSERFALELTESASAEEAAICLWKQTKGIVIVTRGGKGGVYANETGEVRSFPAFPVEVVDTTGCGDVFHGVYAAELARGVSLTERIRFASAAAALKATRHGGQAGIPDRPTVENFLSSKVVE